MKFACYYPRVDYGQSPPSGSSGGPTGSPELTFLPSPHPSQASRLRFSEKIPELPSASSRRVSPKCCTSVRGPAAGVEGPVVHAGAQNSEPAEAAELTPLSLLGARGLSQEGNACREGWAQRGVCKAWPCPSPLTAPVCPPQPRITRPLWVRPGTFWFEPLAAFAWNLGRSI